MDATTCLSLLHLHTYLMQANRHLVLCGITQEMWDVMSNSGLIAIIGKENLFVFDEKHPLAYMQKAISRAKRLAIAPPASPKEKPLVLEEAKLLT